MRVSAGLLWLLSFARVVGASEYLYLDEADAEPVIDQTRAKGFQDSKAPKVVEFYSPHCG